MKIICNTETLSIACSNVQRAVSSKTSIPALEGILIKAASDKVLLTGYDLEVGIDTSVETKVEQEGSIILNAKIFCDILRKLPDGIVTIEADERQLCIIKSGEVEYKLVGISEEEYPELPSVTGGYPIIIDSSVLRDMIRQTIFAVSVNDSKIIHTGVKFEVERGFIKLIAVDGFRMAIRKENIAYTGDNMSFVVPSKTLNEVMKLSEGKEKVSMCVAKRHIIFDIENYSVISRLLDGEFLNYSEAIPKSVTSEVKINVKNFIDSIERTSLLITDKLKSPLRCIFDENMVRISTITSLGTANDKLKAQTDGNRVEIGFNNRYLLDALKVCDCDEVKITLNGALSPITITPVSGEQFLFLVLPVRLKNEG